MKKQRRLTNTLALALVAVTALHGQESEQTVTGGTPFHGVLQYRGKDAKLALIRPSFVAAQDAELADGVSVVGVSIGGVHRAYPLYVLKNHQVVNDTLAEVPVAASW